MFGIVCYIGNSSKESPPNKSPLQELEKPPEAAREVDVPGSGKVQVQVHWKCTHKILYKGSKSVGITDQGHKAMIQGRFQYSYKDTILLVHGSI